jgi:hypothetical protein
VDDTHAPNHADIIELMYSKSTCHRMYGELYKTIDSSDDILHVPDARLARHALRVRARVHAEGKGAHSGRATLEQVHPRACVGLTGELVVVSPHRTKRPWQGQTEPPQATMLSPNTTRNITSARATRALHAHYAFHE